jgi:hypothetical protein
MNRNRGFLKKLASAGTLPAIEGDEHPLLCSPAQKCARKWCQFILKNELTPFRGTATGGIRREVALKAAFDVLPCFRGMIERSFQSVAERAEFIESSPITL